MDTVLVNTANAFANMADAVAQQAQSNLRASGRAGSGALLNSIQPTPLQHTATGLTTGILALSYYKYIDAGVRGTRGGSGAYVFGKAMPGRSMLSSLQHWVQAKGLNIPAKASVTGRARQPGSQSLQAAFAVGKSVLQKGIAPTHFLTNAISTVQQQYVNTLAVALKQDVVQALGETTLLNS